MFLVSYYIMGIIFCIIGKGNRALELLSEGKVVVALDCEGHACEVLKLKVALLKGGWEHLSYNSKNYWRGKVPTFDLPKVEGLERLVVIKGSLMHFLRKLEGESVERFELGGVREYLCEEEVEELKSHVYRCGILSGVGVD
ncbi:MAG: hypothetical protein SP1CHLAM54_01920 [Chlamydiia bacterium]|nr:hypothetical protein [Chlamydiia bacterium]MCH9615110.1 hypothetical protein [Chlamydiia bacterium]MCH9628568.1 hypothetical protein [Chlamydiia bacterium]